MGWVRGRLRSAGSTVSLYTRNGAEVLSTFPELAGVAGGLGCDVVFDGEIVALDRFGRPSFTRLQQRWPMRRRPSSTLLHEVPVRFFAFDALARGSSDLTTRPYLERRRVLDEFAAASTSDVLVVPPSWQGVDPRHMLAAAADQSVEGIVSKRIDSHYVSGRSRDWIKSPVRTSCELAIVGWWPPNGPSRRNEIGTLLLAGRGPDGSLSVVGQVGTGFSEAERRRLYELLVKIPSARAPIVPEPATHGVHWVDPVHVGEVAFREK